MVINPFYLLFSVYFFSIVLSFLAGIEAEGFYILNNFHYVSKESYIVSFLVEVAILFFIAFIYLFVSARNFESKIRLGGFWASFLIVNQIAYIFFVSLTGAGIAGSGFSFGGFNAFNYYFIAINPDLLSFLIIPLLRYNKMAVISLVLLLVSFLVRGWLAGILYFIILYLIRFGPVVISRKRIFHISLSFVVLVLLMPYIVSLKWGVRLGDPVSEIVSRTFYNYNIETVFSSVQLIVERFSHINYTAFLYENLQEIRSDYHAGVFKNYLQNGILYETYCRVFDGCYQDVNSYMVSKFIDPMGKGWNLDVGISGWMFILGWEGFFYIFLWLFVVVFFSLLIFERYGRNYVDLFFSLGLIYFFNSWFSPYYNFVLYLLMFSFAARIRLNFRSLYVSR